MFFRSFFTIQKKKSKRAKDVLRLYFIYLFIGLDKVNLTIHTKKAKLKGNVDSLFFFKKKLEDPTTETHVYINVNQIWNMR